MSVGGVGPRSSPIEPEHDPEVAHPEADAPPAAPARPVSGGFPTSPHADTLNTQLHRMLDQVNADGQARLDATRAATAIGVGPDGAFKAADPAVAEKNRQAVLGPAYASLFNPGPNASFEQQITADAAMAALPAALLAGAAKPAVDKGYSIIDKVPEALRRPLEKNYGLLIDSALTAASATAFPAVGATLDRIHPGGAGLPGAAEVQLQGYSQALDGCAETAAATILKANGVPVSLGEVDTQTANGASGLVEAELRRRGLTAVNGMGDMAKLKSFLAAGYPVMVAVGWEGGGGHTAVVSGYDQAKGTVTIKNWDDVGGTNTVSMAEFEKDWGRHKNYMSAVVPTRDPRLDALVKAGTDLRRPTPIHQGLTLSDFYVTPQGKVFVEGAYRYVRSTTDVTVRVNWNQREQGLERQLGGALSIRQQVKPGWFVGAEIEKMSLVGVDDRWHSFSTSPLSAYGTVEGPGFQLKAGGERGAFQAQAAADLGKLVSGMGAQANLAVDASGNYKVMGSVGFNF